MTDPFRRETHKRMIQNKIAKGECGRSRRQHPTHTWSHVTHTRVSCLIRQVTVASPDHNPLKGGRAGKRTKSKHRNLLEKRHSKEVTG